MAFQAGQRLTAAELNAVTPQTGYVPTTQTVNSTSQVQVAGCAFPVNAETYAVRVVLFLDCNNGGQAEMKFTGPAASLVTMQWSFALLGTGSSTIGETDVSATTGYNTGFLLSNTFSTNRFRAIGEATFTFTAAGTLALAIANGSGASDTFNIIPGSRMDIQQQA